MSTDGPSLELARAFEQLAALPNRVRNKIVSLIRRSSQIQMTDTEVIRVAALMLAMRGEEGMIRSLESGYGTFGSADESNDPGRPMHLLTPRERQKLLAHLLTSRHSPHPLEAEEQHAEPR